MCARMVNRKTRCLQSVYLLIKIALIYYLQSCSSNYNNSKKLYMMFLYAHTTPLIILSRYVIFYYSTLQTYPVTECWVSSLAINAQKCFWVYIGITFYRKYPRLCKSMAKIALFSCRLLGTNKTHNMNLKLEPVLLVILKFFGTRFCF